MKVEHFQMDGVSGWRVTDGKYELLFSNYLEATQFVEDWYKRELDEKGKVRVRDE